MRYRGRKKLRPFTLRYVARFAQGANPLEYALVFILVSLVIVGGAGTLGTNLKELRYPKEEIWAHSLSSASCVSPTMPNVL